MKKTRILICALILSLFLIPTISVLAIDPPSAPTPTVDSIVVYRDCVEEDDWLYLIEYTITYGALPTEYIEEAYIFRIMNGATELKSATAYGYNQQGYDTGIIGIYFSAAEITAKGMVWNTNYTVKIEGNPTLAWTGAGAPDVSSITYLNWYDPMGDQLGEDVLSYAIILSTYWGGNALYENISGSTVLSSYGEDYFGGSIPYLMNMQPQIFLSSITQGDYYERTHATAYAGSIDYTFWNGTWLDMTDVATALAIPESFVYGTLWIVVLLGAIIPVMLISKTFEPIVILSGLLLIMGALLHFVPLLIPIILGAVMILIGVFGLFYKNSYG